MSWNYRIMRFVNPQCKDTTHFYQIHIVHYDENGKPKAHTSHGNCAVGDTLEELSHSHELMSIAFSKPVLEWSEAEGYREA